MIESTQDYYNKDSFAKKLRRLKEEVYFHSHDVCNLFTCVSKGVSFHTMMNATCLAAYHMLRDNFPITKDEIKIFFQF